MPPEAIYLRWRRSSLTLARMLDQATRTTTRMLIAGEAWRSFRSHAPARVPRQERGRGSRAEMTATTLRRRTPILSGAERRDRAGAALTLCVNAGVCFTEERLEFAVVPERDQG